MPLKDKRSVFNEQRKIYESLKLNFLGVDGYDVYNCSLLIRENNKNYIFGRVEKRDEWANSWTALFEQVEADTFRLVADSKTYPLEDPFITKIHGEYVLGGTHVLKMKGKVNTFYGYFYRGKDLKNLTYFTTGPKRMKDIRLVEKPNGKIGVFSRPRGSEIAEIYGSEAVIGYTEIENLNELSDEVIKNAELISNVFHEGEWGGCNQVYCLDNGQLGVIGHVAEKTQGKDEITYSTYMNAAFIFDSQEHCAHHFNIIGTRDCYPKGPAKLPYLSDCVFTSGIVPREDGKFDLYSGMGDCEEGRITIDNPFAGSRIIGPLLY
jgi:hypothetical protein